MDKFRFIDLFAGIGGFHLALSQLGGQCVFASEIDPYAIETYKANFGMVPAHDIRMVDEKSIPRHDVLCAGFPCQAFSKAGRQDGFDDTRGTLFFEILRILKYHRPRFFILENVRNLVAHDGGNTWRVIQRSLTGLGYIIPDKPLIISPHQIGVPQLRDRVFIPGVLGRNFRGTLLDMHVPKAKRNMLHALPVIDELGATNLGISQAEEEALNVWDDFMRGISQRVIGFPIWANALQNNGTIAHLPGWKQNVIRKNRELYKDNREHIDAWLERHNHLSGLTPTNIKFEWQAGNHINSIWEGIIQFRPSGIRVKRPTEFPALVAMVHIPIIGWQKRRLSPREAANLQSFPSSFIINSTLRQAYKQFGNSVNVEVVKFVATQLFQLAQ